MAWSHPVTSSRQELPSSRLSRTILPTALWRSATSWDAVKGSST